MNSRKQILESLISGTATKSQSQDLSAYPWDVEEALVTLTRSHIIAMLDRYLAGEVSAGGIEDWANAIEGRDDIEFHEPYEKAILEAIHELANPLLTVPLTEASAIVLRAKLVG